MTRIIKNMPSMQGVAAGQTALANLPVGLTYTGLIIRHKRSGVDATEAQMKADLGDIRVIIDGDVKIEASATELLDLFQYYGGTVQDGVIPILFARPWQRTAVGEDSLSYGTADVQTFSLEIDIDAAATSPSLEIVAEQAGIALLGKHVTLRRFGRNASATGVLEEANLPRGPYGLLALHATTANIDDVEVEANQRIVYDADTTTATFRDSLTGKAWQSGYTHMNFAPSDRVGDAISLDLQDFRVRMNMSATGTFNLIQERIDSHVAGR
ncbi:MAG: major capsid protein P2 [Alphaproteobacteria bacterium]|nr:major capsid protein P2 [Alphaproteobacteria bacterium]MDD9919037.1 major capsid protein P2 [Alphaproteobacteria bacterium]